MSDMTSYSRQLFNGIFLLLNLIQQISDKPI